MAGGTVIFGSRTRPVCAGLHRPSSRCVLRSGAGGGFTAKPGGDMAGLFDKFV